MKKSELASFIKEEIKSALTVEDTQQDIKDTEELTKATAELAKVKKEAGIEEGAIDPAEYGDIADAYLKGFHRKNNLSLDQLETLGRKIVKQLYKGDFESAKAKFIKEDLKEDEDKEPSKSDLKKTKGLAKAKEELVQLTKQMKSLARKYKEAEGEEKAAIVADLKKKTKLKKELNAIIDK